MIEQKTLFEEPASSDAEKKIRILDYIPPGKENAVSMRYLAMIRKTDTRAVRSMVLNARIAGHVIIGDDYGYYQPCYEEDLTGWIRREEATLRSKERALRSAKEALAEGRYPKAVAE